MLRRHLPKAERSLAIACSSSSLSSSSSFFTRRNIFLPVFSVLVCSCSFSFLFLHHNNHHEDFAYSVIYQQQQQQQQRKLFLGHGVWSHSSSRNSSSSSSSSSSSNNSRNNTQSIPPPTQQKSQQQQLLYDSFHISVNGKLVSNHTTGTTTSLLNSNSNSNNKTRVLYTVTTLKEYNDGKRSTRSGSDRFVQTLLPIIEQGVQSILSRGYHVDVYLICAYTLTTERRQRLQQVLPPSVGLQVWDDATPYAYNMRDLPKSRYTTSYGQTGVKNTSSIALHSRGLARQHRFVLKDKLPFYDLFIQFEDDMLVTGHHVDHFIKMTRHLEFLHHHQQKKEEEDDDEEEQEQEQENNRDILRNIRYYGSLSSQQLERIIPGFLRVEVVANATATPIPEITVKIPVDNSTTSLLDPSQCCHLMTNTSNYTSSSNDNSTHSSTTATIPTVQQLITWETQIIALGVRQMPQLQLSSSSSSSPLTTTTKLLPRDYNAHTNDGYTLDWVALQRGTSIYYALSDYWSGTPGYYQNDTLNFRPGPGERKYSNNQGGYMATQSQLIKWHSKLCMSSFLPPYDGNVYGHLDGLDLRDVEYWSGGMQLIVEQCGLQRVLNLDPTEFMNHVLWHTANNKQHQLQYVRERFTRLNDLYGMLMTIQKHAQRDQNEILLKLQEDVQHGNKNDPKQNSHDSKANASGSVNITNAIDFTTVLSACQTQDPDCFPPHHGSHCIQEKALACLLGTQSRVF